MQYSNSTPEYVSFFEMTKDQIEEGMRRDIKGFLAWLTKNYLYRQAYVNGIQASKANPNANYQTIQNNAFELHFYAGYGVLKLQILNDLTLWHIPSEWSIFDVFNKWDVQHYSVDQAIRYCGAMHELAMTVLPNATANNKVCLCQSGACDPARFFMKRYDGQMSILNPENLICTLHGGLYMCDACKDHLVLEAPSVSLPSGINPKAERSKMSNSLRFSVMQRDNFACKACGRTYREDGVKLHVDHIHPVSKGGKTELPNLHTLCSDCDLGKSAKLVPEMETWNDK